MWFCESLTGRCLNASSSSALRPPVCCRPRRLFWGGGVALEGCAGCPLGAGGGRYPGMEFSAAAPPTRTWCSGWGNAWPPMERPPRRTTISQLLLEGYLHHSGGRQPNHLDPIGKSSFQITSRREGVCVVSPYFLLCAFLVDMGSRCISS